MKNKKLAIIMLLLCLSYSLSAQRYQLDIESSTKDTLKFLKAKPSISIPEGERTVWYFSSKGELEQTTTNYKITEYGLSGRTTESKNFFKVEEGIILVYYTKKSFKKSYEPNVRYRIIQSDPLVIIKIADKD
jgi:hypothetical protein